MESGRRGLELRVFYQKNPDRYSPLPLHKYTFEISRHDEPLKSYWDKDAVSAGRISLSRLPTKVRRTLERHYEKYLGDESRTVGNPSCGNITYKVFPDGNGRTAFSTDYHPRLYIHSKGERKARARPGIGALFEYLSLSHLIPKEKVTRVSIYDALKAAVEKTGDPKKRALLVPNHGFFATIEREAQLRKKRIDPERIYPAASWLQKLKQKRLDSRRPTRLVTSKSRRSI